MKVSKIEEINSIKKTLCLNNEAIDYIENHISDVNDVLGYKPDDEQAQYELKISRYICFSLEYLDKCYRIRLKQLGIRNFKVEDYCD